jgi:hypothetical protein
MLSSEVNQKELMVKRIEQVVSTLMAEEPLFARDLDRQIIIDHLVEIFAKNFADDQFSQISFESLKNRCSGIMALQILAKIGEEFTPDQMAIFDSAIKRK